MSCCPTAPPIKVAAASDAPTGIADNQPLHGESTECFMATAANPTGQHDDATGNVSGKIETPTIPLDKDARAKVKFKMQLVNPPVEADEWVMIDDDGNTPAWLNSSFSSTGQLDVLFDPVYYGKKIRVTVSAKKNGTELDNRGYVFSPDKASGSDSIQFVHPLPGAVVTSRFDLQRVHPVLKIVKPHFGCDFALAGGKIGDVLAAADGEVIFKGFEGKGAGNYVKVKHLNTAGKHLCTTVYMHMETVYVSEGQRVAAGQKIGREGNTGIGTGAHLHFECRLPNDTRIDPEPLIRGELQIARTTDENNEGSNYESSNNRSSNAVLTPANVDAKQSGCSPYGSEYPSPQTPVGADQSAPPSTGADPFDFAWDLTMQTEVIGWEGTPPTQASTIAGLIDTKERKRAVGFVDHPSDPGGKTKFGIASRYNKNLSVDDINYQQSRDAGYSKYWVGTTAESLASTKPKTSIAAFNLGFLCGQGGLKTILTKAGATSISDDVQCLDAVCDQAKIYLRGLANGSTKLKTFENGWMSRVEKVRAYAKAAAV